MRTHVQHVMHRALRATFIALIVLGVGAQLASAASIPRDYIQAYRGSLLIFNPADTSAIESAKRAIDNMAGRATVVAFHGQPGVLATEMGRYPVGTTLDDIINVTRAELPGFARADQRVLLACYGNVAAEDGTRIATRFADAFSGNVHAANGWIHFDVADAVRGSVRTTQRLSLLGTGYAVEPSNAWAEVAPGGHTTVMSEDDFFRRVYGEGVTITNPTLDANSTMMTSRHPDFPGAPQSFDDYAKGGEYERMWSELEDRYYLERPGGASGFSGAADVEAFARPSGSRVRAALSQAADGLRASPTVRLGTLVGAGLLLDWAIYRGVRGLTGNEAWAQFATIPGGVAGTAAVEHFVFGATWAESFGASATAGTSFRLGAATTSFAGVASVAALGIQLNLMAWEIRQGIDAQINDPDFNGFTPEEEDAYFVNGFEGYGRALYRTYIGEW